LTIIFWLIASSMTLLILVLLLWPLLKRTVVVTGEQEKTLSIFRQQFSELQQDRANGVLTDELYEQARRELERRLLEETGTTDTAPKVARRQMNSRPVAFALAVIIPTVSGLIYWQIGNPLAMTQPTAAQLAAQGSSEDAHPTADSLEALIEQTH
jgi:cytochrome c-type biogenesis protein CcmH